MLTTKVSDLRYSKNPQEPLQCLEEIPLCSMIAQKAAVPAPESPLCKTVYVFF